MTNEEFIDKLNEIQRIKCETQFVEIKSAHIDCPKKLYDTLSGFSNQDDGGIIVFGVDEEHDFQEVGVYDPQDLQKKVNAQCLQMEPPVRPLFTVLEKDGKHFVSAEIPGIDLSDRPCYYKGKGRLKGSYVRIGDSDEPMTEYEIYSYEAFRKKYQDDIRGISRATFGALDSEQLSQYVNKLKAGKPNLANISDTDIFELMSITRDKEITLSATLLFSLYPQAYFPQLCITAVVVAGTEIGDLGEHSERFIDNERIEGTIPQMLDSAIQFVRRNMRNMTIIDPTTGKRNDRTDYPITAVREALVNALVHRDYSIHTEGMPIQLLMFEDRLEIRNPGGLYGKLRIDQLGKVQPDTRNPVLAAAMEVMGITENRYSGIPTIRKCMTEYELMEPVFADDRGSFVVIFYKQPQMAKSDMVMTEAELKLYEFCKIPRSRHEIAEFMGLSSVSYAIQRYVNPFIKKGLIAMKYPDKPKRQDQLYFSIE